MDTVKIGMGFAEDTEPGVPKFMNTRNMMFKAFRNLWYGHGIVQSFMFFKDALQRTKLMFVAGYERLGSATQNCIDFQDVKLKHELISNDVQDIGQRSLTFYVTIYCVLSYLSISYPPVLKRGKLGNPLKIGVSENHQSVK